MCWDLPGTDLTTREGNRQAALGWALPQQESLLLAPQCHGRALPQPSHRQTQRSFSKPKLSTLSASHSAETGDGKMHDTVTDSGLTEACQNGNVCLSMPPGVLLMPVQSLGQNAPFRAPLTHSWTLDAALSRQELERLCKNGFKPSPVWLSR